MRAEDTQNRCISLDIGFLRSQVGTSRRETQTNNHLFYIEREWILTAKTRVRMDRDKVKTARLPTYSISVSISYLSDVVSLRRPCGD
jgi:hypothetical protein